MSRGGAWEDHGESGGDEREPERPEDVIETGDKDGAATRLWDRDKTGSWRWDGVSCGRRRVWMEIGNGERFGGVNGMELESRTGLRPSLGLEKGIWIGVGRGSG